MQKAESEPHSFNYSSRKHNDQWPLVDARQIIVESRGGTSITGCNLHSVFALQDASAALVLNSARMGDWIERRGVEFGDT